MWSCAIPHPKVVQSIPCTCSALEYQLHLGGYKQRTPLLNSGILDSTCVPSREEEEDRGEGHPTCEACRPYMHVFYKYYASAFKALGCGWHLSRPQVLVGFTRVTVHVLCQQSSFVSWLLNATNFWLSQVAIMLYWSRNSTRRRVKLSLGIIPASCFLL